MLEVTGIEKRYRGRTILKNVSFRANPGACIGIVGGNGCGKTTLLSILAGIRKPDRGSIRIDGQEALGRHRLLEEKIAYVPQENPLIPELTAFDNYRLWFRGKRREMERDLECGVGRVLENAGGTAFRRREKEAEHRGSTLRARGYPDSR